MQCPSCQIEFDTNYRELESERRHRLPVSCEECSHTVCHVCYAAWVNRLQYDTGYVPCPECGHKDGFDAARTNINRFACLLLEQLQVKPDTAVSSNPNAKSPDPVVSAGTDPASTPDTTRSLPVAVTPTKSTRSKYPIGTSVRKFFEGYGWYNGHVTAIVQSHYVIFYEDEDREHIKVGDPEMDEIVQKARDFEKANSAGSAQTILAAVPVVPATPTTTSPATSSQQQRDQAYQSSLATGFSVEEPVVPPRPRKRRKRVHAVEITAEERGILRNMKNWTDDMRTYLIEKEELSPSNQKSVIRQVVKMLSGSGIEYKNWARGVIFKPDMVLDLSFDFDAMLTDAITFEAKHGRDLGNGWLLRHPIKKLGNYQQYIVQQKLRKKSPPS